MADRDEFLQVIRQELSPNVETADGLLYRSAIEKRGHGRMGVARVNDKQTLGRESSNMVFPMRLSKQSLDVMICVQRWTYLNVSLTFVTRVVLILRTKASTVRGEFILFEDDLITICLKGCWRIRRFCENEICVLRVTLLTTQHIVLVARVANTYHQLGIFLKECIIPDGFLSLPIDKKALLDRPTKRNFAKVIAFLQLCSDPYVFPSVLCETIWDDLTVFETWF